jgi:hypothetical protein
MENYYEKVKTGKRHPNPNYGVKHSFHLPLRMLICGASGSGKSNTLLNFLSVIGSVFKVIVFCVKTRDEPLYELLDSKTEDGSIQWYQGTMKKLCANGRRKLQQNMPPLNEINKKERTKKNDDEGVDPPTLIVFDDCVMDANQEDILQYFIRGRKRNVSCIYLSQSYYTTPKDIRLNCSNVLLKAGNSAKDLNRMLKEFSVNLSQPELIQAYNDSTGSFEGFLHVDLLKGKVYNSFSIDPLETCGGSRVVNGSSGLLKVNDMGSISKFAHELGANAVSGSYELNDLYDYYKSNAEDPSLPKRTFSNRLSEYFKRWKADNRIQFIIKPLE